MDVGVDNGADRVDLGGDYDGLLPDFNSFGAPFAFSPPVVAQEPQVTSNRVAENYSFAPIASDTILKETIQRNMLSRINDVSNNSTTKNNELNDLIAAVARDQQNTASLVAKQAEAAEAMSAKIDSNNNALAAQIDSTNNSLSVLQKLMTDLVATNAARDAAFAASEATKAELEASNAAIRAAKEAQHEATLTTIMAELQRLNAKRAPSPTPSGASSTHRGTRRREHEGDTPNKEHRNQ